MAEIPAGREQEERDIAKAEALMDERKFQEHMEEQGARQIGICLYEETNNEDGEKNV